MSTTVGAHSGTGPLSLMSCVRESSPLQDYDHEVEKNVVSKRKFWNPKKWFRKKQKTGEEAVVHHHHHHQESRDVDGGRSRSTGELSTDEELPKSHHEIRNSTSMHPGLSVSHDSVFHPLNSGSSDLELDGAQSSSSLSISQPLGDAKLQTELSSKLRLRRGRGDTSEDDEGLPRSPPCGSPAAATDSFLILEKTVNNKDLPTKSHSTCSDGSLLSMDSSEMDEDSVGPQSRHSSRVSLNEKRPPEQESDLELGPSFSTVPLNHSAAHHRVSVRPKRTYGAPRRKKGQLSSALPATPEVNEDSSIRSISPESVITEPITDLYSGSARNLHKSTAVPPEVKLKCNSLPAGAVPPTSGSFRLSRSRSNAGKSQDDADLRGEDREERVSLFERLFPRRSAKKKRKEEERLVHQQQQQQQQHERVSIMEVDGDAARISVSEKSVQVHKSTPSSMKQFPMTSIHAHTKPTVAPRTGAASRQRIQPIDIPASPGEQRVSVQEKASFSPGTSPIQLELESLLRQRQLSKESPCLDTPPESPREDEAKRPPRAFATSVVTASTTSTITKVISEDIRSKVKLPGLSALQQRVLSLDSAEEEEEEDPPFKSLTEVAPVKPQRTSLAKSHSFKNEKPLPEKKPPQVTAADVVEPRRKSVTKASSLDSVKNLEEPPRRSELTLALKSHLTKAEKEAEVDEIEVAASKNDPAKLTTPRSSINSSITITGPSHTAVVNVTASSFTKTSESATMDKDASKKAVAKETSVTKIQLKQEQVTTTTTTTTTMNATKTVPEFLNKQLNKVEVRPASNVVFSMKSPKISPEETASRPKTLFNFPSNGEVNKLPRKFSKEDVEIIESSPEVKDVSPPKTPPVVAPTTPTQNRFKKNDSKPSSRKSSVISITSPDSPPIKESIRDRALKTRSISLDSLKSEENRQLSTADKASQDSLADGVVLRRKSFAKQKNEEEPELMKVFARRSLKLKDEDVGQLQEAIADADEQQRQRDSDKENNAETIPEKKPEPVTKEDVAMVAVKPSKLPLTEIKKSPEIINKKSPEIIKSAGKEDPEVQLRRSLNNNIFLSTQRAASLNMPKTVVTDFHIKKQASLNERRRTEQWIHAKKEEDIEERKVESELIVESKGEEVRTETKKNFSQRRAEWEKRVQQAQK